MFFRFIPCQGGESWETWGTMKINYYVAVIHDVLSAFL